MKKYITALLLTLFIARVDATVAEADSAYSADDFLRAASLYESAIDSLGPDADRYYNLGNAYYRAGLTGMAIVSYERARRLDPSNSDIADNLEFVNAGTKDLITPSESLFGGAADRIAGRMHPDTWAWIALTAFVLALCGVIIYFFAGSVAMRKVGFFGGGLLLVFCVIANILAVRATRKVTSTGEAIVVSPSVILSTTPRQPRDRSEEAMLLHEGAKVSIVDSISAGADGKDVWYDVKVGDKQRAWIPGEAIEII